VVPGLRPPFSADARKERHRAGLAGHPDLPAEAGVSLPVKFEEMTVTGLSIILLTTAVLAVASPVSAPAQTKEPLRP
jgi:hypothetical protein